MRLMDLNYMKNLPIRLKSDKIQVSTILKYCSDNDCKTLLEFSYITGIAFLNSGNDVCHSQCKNSLHYIPLHAIRTRN